MNIQVVYALPDVQYSLDLTLSEGATVGDAIALAREDVVFARFALMETQVGVWGEIVSHDHALSDGDRLEVYRGLEIDPKQARRERASRRIPAPAPDRE